MLGETGMACRAQPDWAWPMHGGPQSLHLDDASEFHSRALKRGCQQQGMRIDYRPPATPRFGGHIERLMGTLMTRIHALPGTTSSNVVARGDYPAEQKAILTLGEFERILALEILGPYHNEVHSALHTTPAAAWAAGVAAHAVRCPPIRPLSCWISCRSRSASSDATACACSMSPISMARWRRCWTATRASAGSRYHPRDMSAVFVELPTGGHLRLACADLGRPAVTLWEQRAATHTLRAEGRANVDEAAVFAAIATQRRVLAEAQATSKAARRTTARLPDQRSTAIELRLPPAPDATPPEAANEDDARVPCVVDEEAWKTEFLA